MATPMLFMASDEISTSQETKPVKTRGRKSTKSTNQKKLPQRGLGVAQLERLRLQERWKKMTELPGHSHPHFHYQGSVPMEYAAPSYGGAPATVNGCTAGSVLGFDCPGLAGPMMGNGGFMVVDPYPQMDPRVLIGCAVETSRELSSMPNIPLCASHHCDVCFKKKRFTPINDSDIVGLNMEIPSDFTGCVTYKGAEVKKIHRKVGKRGEGGSLVMEYEFFPGKVGTHFKEIVMPTEASFAQMEEEASYITSTTAIYAASGTPDAHLDLSLKLSL